MREIVSKPLDRESFRPYGDFVDLLHIKQMDAMAGADNIFMPDLTTLRLDERMQASVCVARVSQCERIITAVEYHGFTSEGILPLDGDIDIFVGPSSFQVNPASIEAFRVPKGTFGPAESRCASRPPVCRGFPERQCNDLAAGAYLRK